MSYQYHLASSFGAAYILRFKVFTFAPRIAVSSSGRSQGQSESRKPSMCVFLP